MADRNVVIQGLIELHLAGKGGDEAVASMKKILGQTKEIEAGVGGFGKKTEEATAKVGALEKGMASLGRTVAGYFAAGAVANFLRDSYIGFARTERQALAVENQIKSLGGSLRDAGFREFIAQLSDSSGIIDDSLVPAFQRALLVFKDVAAAKEILNIATKFEIAGITDTITAVNALSSVYQTGSVRPLKELGIVTKDAAGETINFNEALKLVYATLSQQGAAFDDAQSRVLTTRKAWDDFSDTAAGVSDELLHMATSWRYLTETLDPSGIIRARNALKDLGEIENLGPFQETPEQKALRETAEKQAADRAKKDADALSKDKLKIEEDRLAKVEELNEKSVQALIKQVASQYEEGSRERVNLELELNRRVEEAAIESANKIGADTLAIAAFFAGERGKIAASAGETKSQKDTRETEAEFDPRAGFELVEAAAEEHQLALDDIAKTHAEIRNEIANNERLWAETQEKAKTQSALQAAGQITGVLASTFAKHKAFAIAMAIANTALGITEVWTDKSLHPWYVKLAAIVTVAASGAAQIAAIRGASIGGGGGGGGASIASAPTQSANAPAQVAPQSQSVVDAISGRSVASAGSTVVNIGTAFGDQQAMTKLARQIARVTSNDQSALR